MDRKIPILARTEISLAHPSMPMPAGEVHQIHQENNQEEILQNIKPNQEDKQEFHQIFKAHVATPPTEVMAQLWTNFPTPNTRGMAQALLSRWAIPTEEKKRRSPLLIIGEAGTGKTSTVETTAKLVFGLKRHATEPEENPEPIVFAAGGRNLDELLIEPWFNEESKPIAKTLMDSFNGIGHPPMSPPTRRMIEEGFPNAIIDGKINLFDLTLNEESIQTLTNIAEFEGLIKRGSTLGVELKEGALIQAVRTGRILIVDEADKAIPGAKINEVLQAIAGRIEHPVEFSEKGINYTFSEENIHGDFDLVMTANNLADSGRINTMGEATLQRFQKIFVSNVGSKDITERLAQKLLGFNPAPLLAIKASNKVKANLAKEVFETAGKPLTEDNLFLIRQLDKTMQACRQMAACIRLWGDTVDPRNPKVTDPILEENRGIGVETPAVRFAQGIIEDSLLFNPRKTQGQDQTKVLDEDRGFGSILQEISKTEDLQEHFQEMGLGEKIENMFAQRIAQFPAGDATKGRFTQAAVTCGIFPDPDEENNTNPKKLDLIKDLLNTLSPELEIEPETYDLQKKLCNRIRKEHRAAKQSKDEEIIPASKLQELINELSKVDPEKNPKKEGQTFTLGLNPNYMKEVQGSPIRLIPIVSTLQHSEVIKTFKESHGMATGELIDGLNHPTVRKNLLETLWTQSLDEASQEDEVTTALLGGNANLRIAKVLTRKEDNTSDLTLVFHSKSTNTFVVFNPNLKEETATREGFLISSDAKKVAALLENRILANNQTLLRPLVACMITPNQAEIDKAEKLAQEREDDSNPMEILCIENTLEELLKRATAITPQRCPIRVPLKLTEAEMEPA